MMGGPQPPRPSAVELFAGQGQLSHQLWQIGFDVISIDHFVPAKAVTPITKIDLAEGARSDSFDTAP